MKILIACEESQTLAKRFRELGHEAYSCDLQPCSGGHPEFHLQEDVRKHLAKKWDLIIAHPPCTYLAVCGNRWFKNNPERERQREEAIKFFMLFTELDCPHVAIENPIGVMSSRYRKPDQIIEPWQFGESYSKKTCLWLKGLPKLNPTKTVDKGEFIIFPSGRRMPKWYADAYGLKPAERSRIRSKTFEGIADAMVTQWIEYLERNKTK